MVYKPTEAESRRAARIARFHLFWHGLAPWHVLFARTHSVTATVIHRGRQRLVRVEFSFANPHDGVHPNLLARTHARCLAAAVDLTEAKVVRLWLAQ